MSREAQTDRDRTTEAPAGYEPPRVEQVLNPGDLERENLYAGVDTSVDT
jgi:hypothetical protein